MRMRAYLSLAVLAVAGAARPTSAAALPALGNVTTNADKQAAQVTIGTGAVAVIPGSSVLTGAAMAISDTAYDETGNRMFVADVTNNELLTLSMADGSVLSGPTLSPPAGVSAYTDLEWDAAEAVLYGIVTVAGGDKQLATFNLVTGVVTLIGSPIAGGSNVGTYSQPFDLDTAGNRYYMVGSPAAGDTLYSINTGTGLLADSKLLSTPGILPPGVTTVFGLEHDPVSGVLYALVGFASGAKQLATVDTTSGASFGTVSLLGPGSLAAGGSIAFSGHEALDATGDRYYLTGSIGGAATLFSIDTSTGVLADQDALTFGPGINDVRAMEFDGVGSLPVELQSLTVE